MFLQYGSYVHDTNEASVTISRVALFNEAGLRHGYLETWRIRGILQEADQDTLTISINALKAAYLIQDRNIGLFFDSGAATAHVMLSSQTLGGVRVIEGPSFPVGEGAEYSTFRSYEITVEAEFRSLTIGLLAWTESIVFGGGGTRFVMQQPLQGMPVRQLVAEATPYTAQQTGSAIGQFTYPVPSAPIWPADEHRDQRRIERGQPRRHGNGYAEYPISWSYSFEAAAPLIGLPRLWPSN